VLRLDDVNSIVCTKREKYSSDLSASAVLGRIWMLSPLKVMNKFVNMFHEYRCVIMS
jgi:hypothetical protein